MHLVPQKWAHVFHLFVAPGLDAASRQASRVEFHARSVDFPAHRGVNRAVLPRALELWHVLFPHLVLLPRPSLDDDGVLLRVCLSICLFVVLGSAVPRPACACGRGGVR